MLVGAAAVLSGLIILPVAAGVAIVAPELVPLRFGKAGSRSCPPPSADGRHGGSTVHTDHRLRQRRERRRAVAVRGLGTADRAAMAAALVSRAAIMLPVGMLVARHATGREIPRLCALALWPLAATFVMTAALLVVRDRTPRHLELDRRRGPFPVGSRRPV